MFSATLYDTVYLYIKIASTVLSEPGKGKQHITNGTFMNHRSKNYKTTSSKYFQNLLLFAFFCRDYLEAIIL